MVSSTFRLRRLVNKLLLKMLKYCLKNLMLRRKRRRPNEKQLPERDQNVKRKRKRSKQKRKLRCVLYILLSVLIRYPRPCFVVGGKRRR